MSHTQVPPGPLVPARLPLPPGRRLPRPRRACRSAARSRRRRPPRSARPASSWCATATPSPRSTSTSTRWRSGCSSRRRWPPGAAGRRRPGQRGAVPQGRARPRRTCSASRGPACCAAATTWTTSTSSSTGSSAAIDGHRARSPSRRCAARVPAAARRLPRGRRRRGDGPGGRAPPAGTPAERDPGAPSADPAGRLAAPPWRVGARPGEDADMGDYRATYRPQHRGPRRRSGPTRRGTSSGGPSRRPVLDAQPRAVLPVVPRRRAEHLRERAGPARRRRARRPGRARLRQPGHRHPAHLHLRGAARPRSRPSPGRSPRSACSKGDRVVIYLPMVPEAVVAMLACARLGAVHSVVFGGFAANELAARIEDAEPKVVVSASCGIEVSRVIEYKPLLDRALELSSHQPEHVVVLQRPQAAAAMTRAARPRLARAGRRRRARRVRAGRGHRPALRALHLGHDRQAQGRRARQRRPRGRPAVVDGEHLRRRAAATCGGPPPTSAGSSATPTSSTRRCWWARRRCSTRASRSARRTPARSGGSSREYGVQALFTAPTAIRAVKKEDPDGARLAEHDVSSLRTLFLAGERLDPDTWEWADRAARRPGHRPLVADRDRLADRRQPARARADADQARVADRAGARLRRAGARPVRQRGRRRAPRARSASSCRCRPAPCRRCGATTTGSSRRTCRRSTATT